MGKFLQNDAQNLYYSSDYNITTETLENNLLSYQYAFLLWPHLPGSDFDFVVSTIFLISVFTRMKPKEKLVREDNEIKLGPIPNCRVKYRWRAKSKL